MRTRWLFILCIVLGAIVAAFFNSVLVLSILFLAVALWFLVRNLEFGLIILVFFFPYLGLVIDFGQIEVFREVPYLKNINAPFIDLYGLLFFVAWLISGIKNVKLKMKNDGDSGVCLNVLMSGRSTPKILHFTFYILHYFPHFKSYLFFWLSGLISLLKVSAINAQVSFKYFARPFTFFYLVFFAPVVSILTREKHNPTRPPLNLRGGEEGLSILHRVLMVFYFTGLLSAVNGLWGLFFGAHTDFFRATPFAFFGINPLGPNHNLLAETLIATAPAGLILMQNEKLKIKNGEPRKKNFTFYILHFTLFQWGIALLTFARTAWIAVAVQALVYLFLNRHPERSEGSRPHGRDAHTREILRSLWSLRMTLVGVCLAIAAIFLVLTMASETVRGSTLSRLDQARIAEFYFLRSPIVGQGIGTFIPTLWGTRAFLLEYGEPLEAHGILFKLMFEQGMLGLITFALFIGSIVWSLYRAYRSDNTNPAFLAALLIASGALTYQLFNTTYYTSKLWVPLAIAVAIAKGYEQKE